MNKVIESKATERKALLSQATCPICEKINTAAHKGLGGWIIYSAVCEHWSGLFYDSDGQKMLFKSDQPCLKTQTVTNKRK